MAGEDAGDSSTHTVAPVTVAVTTPLDAAHAPWPRNAGERILFAQLYEPLIRLDCTGAVVPALAQSWGRTTRGDTATGMDAKSRDSTSRRARSRESGVSRWTFTLRHGARFTDGARVRAVDVIASWRASAEAHSSEPIGALIATIARAAHAADDSTLVIELPDSLASLRTFASPQLGVARPPPSGSRWPYGTTSYHVDSTLEHYGPGPPRSLPAVASIGLRPRASSTPPGTTAAGDSAPAVAPPLLFHSAPDADGRDILDWGADLLITSSPAAVEYARTLEDYASIPLPWTRLYVLVLPGRDDVLARADDQCTSAELRPLADALAAAVRAEVRGAEGPCWWATGGGDGAPVAHDRTRQPSRKIRYPMNDPTARELAERIVALAAPGLDGPATAALRRAAPAIFEPTGWSASGTDSVQFVESLARATEGGYILALPREPAWPAAARASLLASAPWLSPLARASAVVSLVDTRETLLIRRSRGIPRMTILHDGGLTVDAGASTNSGNAGGANASNPRTP